MLKQASLVFKRRTWPSCWQLTTIVANSSQHEGERLRHWWHLQRINRRFKRKSRKKRILIAAVWTASGCLRETYAKLMWPWPWGAAEDCLVKHSFERQKNIKCSNWKYRIAWEQYQPDWAKQTNERLVGDCSCTTWKKSRYGGFSWRNKYFLKQSYWHINTRK